MYHRVIVTRDRCLVRKSRRTSRSRTALIITSASGARSAQQAKARLRSVESAVRTNDLAASVVAGIMTTAVTHAIGTRFLVTTVNQGKIL